MQASVLSIMENCLIFTTVTTPIVIMQRYFSVNKTNYKESSMHNFMK